MQPTSINVELYQGTVKYNTISLPQIANDGTTKVWKYEWDNLPKYDYTRNADGTVTQTPYEYTLKEVISSPYGEYYTTAYNPTDTKGDCVTITNTLQTAKFRVAKRINNYETATKEIDKKDLDKDEFIIEVEKDTPEGNPFKTGLVLNHAANSDEEVMNHLDKVSGYIIVPVKADGVLYSVNEIVPKEYDYVNLSVINNKYKGETVAKIEGDKVRIKPGADAIVIVHNTFDHDDYFHSDASVDNPFNLSKGNSNPPEEAKTEPVNMFTLVPEYALTLERNDGKQKKLDEDDRLV